MSTIKLLWNTIRYSASLVMAIALMSLCVFYSIYNLYHMFSGYTLSEYYQVRLEWFTNGIIAVGITYLLGRE